MGGGLEGGDAGYQDVYQERRVIYRFAYELVGEKQIYRELQTHS